MNAKNHSVLLGSKNTLVARTVKIYSLSNAVDMGQMAGPAYLARTVCVTRLLKPHFKSSC